MSTDLVSLPANTPRSEHAFDAQVPSGQEPILLPPPSLQPAAAAELEANRLKLRNITRKLQQAAAEGMPALTSHRNVLTEFLRLRRACK